MIILCFILLYFVLLCFFMLATIADKEYEKYYGFTGKKRRCQQKNVDNIFLW